MERKVSNRHIPVVVLNNIQMEFCLWQGSERSCDSVKRGSLDPVAKVTNEAYHSENDAMGMISELGVALYLGITWDCDQRGTWKMDGYSGPDLWHDIEVRSSRKWNSMLVVRRNDFLAYRFIHTVVEDHIVHIMGWTYGSIVRDHPEWWGDRTGKREDFKCWNIPLEYLYSMDTFVL